MSARVLAMTLLAWALMAAPVGAAEPGPEGAAAAPAPKPAATPEPKPDTSAPKAATPKPETSLAARRLATVPEIGQCRREPLRTESVGDVRKVPEALSAKDLALRRERIEWEKVLERFVAASIDYRAEVDQVLERSFAGRRDNLGKRYGKQTDEIELEERQRRNDAIRRFERFIQKYPSDPSHTPDAMFRLAELYYERSAVDYADAQDLYSKERDLYERGKIPSEPQQPRRDYSDSVKLYRTLLNRFSDEYRYADAVYYLLGYVLQESAEDLESRKAWLTLAERYPKSQYAPEVYLRVGESHFDYGEFTEAADAYKKAMAYTESRFYDKALYKLAWTYFQMYDYDSAIKTFKTLIGYYDDNKQEGGATAAALREEAIDYLAKSLAEDDWDNDGLDDANRGVGRALAYMSDGASYEMDIVAKYAESLYDLHDKKKYAEAIEVYRELIKRQPTALGAVRHQQQIIKIFDILRDIDAATRERQQLADMFAAGSPWARANRKHSKQLSEASEAVEAAMRRRALFLHQRAQELKAQAKIEERPELLAEAFDSYKKAAKAYGDYLVKYPAEPTSYEMRFYLSETQYYSGQFRAAAGTYMEVARDPHHAKFREPSAWSAVKSYEKLLVTAANDGVIPAKTDPNAAYEPDDSEDSGTAKLIAAEALPQEAIDWLRSVDFYVLRDITKDGSRQPQAKLAYQAADLTYRFKDYTSARDRFKQVIACFPDEEVAAFAMANIINTYRDENDFPKLEKWADIADKLQLGDSELTQVIRKDIRTFKLGAQFQRAQTLLDAKKYLEAGREFERLADQNQDATFLDKAYFNAAKAYKEVKYYDSAARIFEKLVTDSRFTNSEFKEDSLFELAENYKLFFNYEKAVSTYQTWYGRSKNANHPNRPYALFTAGKMQEYAGNLQQAARTYEQYSTSFEDRNDAANALFRASELYDKLGEPREQKRILKSFISRYNEAQGMGTRVLHSMLTLGDMAKDDGKWRDAGKYYKDVIREYEVRGHQPGTAAADSAAKAKFELVERKFQQYLKIRLKGTSQRRMTTDLARKKKMLDELELEYGEVLPYKSLDWTIASFFRLGELYKEFAQTLYAAPQPNLPEEQLEVFITMIEDEGLKYENVAIERFQRTVLESRRLKVTNSWARRALEAINAYKPQEFPLFKETKKQTTFAPIYRIETNIPEPR